MSDTRPLPAAPARYRAERRRPGVLRGLVRDFTIIFTAWALAAYPILWLCSHVLGPAVVARFVGGTP